MCGLAGFWGRGDASENKVQLKSMIDAIAHRGPDGEGTWSDADAGIYLGHRRLAIIDVSDNGLQPMQSACSRFAMVFNGEIYNHLDLRKRVEAKQPDWSWRGHSDTETTLACITLWGFEHTLSLLNGMFAIVVWDRETRQLFMARDRMGEKPFYYGFVNGVFLFASELKGIKANKAFEGTIDRNSLSQYMRLSHIAPESSIYENIHKLPASSWACIGSPNEKVITKKYWNLAQIATGRTVSAPLDQNIKQDYINELEQRLLRTVNSRMLSDVPLGAFLSGGYDSSLIVALMQAQSDQKVKTFTIGFEDEAYNEAPHAKKVADYLGTNHTQLTVTAQDALDIVPQLPAIWDEPFADSSQIPTFLVSKLAQQDVTVSLSGDGGDELFGGYSRYQKAQSIWDRMNRIPKSARQLMASTARFSAPKLAGLLDNVKGARANHVKQLLDRSESLGQLFSEGTSADLYVHMMSHFSNPDQLVLNGKESICQLTDQAGWPQLDSYLDMMMYLDSVSYLPNTILTKVDRASMAVGLESRAPMLDHELVEFAWQLPKELLVNEGQGKWILTEVAHKYIPKEIMQRPKMGFGIPVGDWLRGELKDWVEALIEPNRIRSEGFLDHKLVTKYWNEHKSGRRDWQYHLWDIVMFQAWLEHNHNAR